MNNMEEYNMNKKENHLFEKDTRSKKVYCAPKLVEIGSVQKKTFGTKSVNFDDGTGVYAGES